MGKFARLVVTAKDGGTMVRTALWNQLLYLDQVKTRIRVHDEKLSKGGKIWFLRIRKRDHNRISRLVTSYHAFFARGDGDKESRRPNMVLVY